MANFRVGQRVKVVALDESPSPADLAALGKEGVIAALGPVFTGLFARHTREYHVLIPGEGNFGFDAWHLAPLTPPASDAWAAEKVKQLTHFHTEPVIEKEKA